MKSSLQRQIVKVLLPLVWPVAAFADAGFKDSWSYPVAEVTIGTRTVISRCIDGRITGMREEFVDGEAYFGAGLPTAANLRVRIVNQTLNTGSAATTPYTDRAYDNESSGLSEFIRFAAGTQHRGSVFVVTPGRLNKFGYAVYDRNTQVSLETGSFQAEVIETVFPDREELSTDLLCNRNPLPPLPFPPLPPIPPHHTAH